MAAFAAIDNGRALAIDLKGLHRAWFSTLESERVRSDARAWRILAHRLSQPAVTSGVIQHRVGVSQPAADNALRLLSKLEIVSKPSNVQRNIVWVADGVIAALDAFGDRARRG